MKKRVCISLKIATFKYFIKEGIKGVWRNRIMFLASTGTVAASLFVLGIFWLFSDNINFIGNQVESSLQLQAFLKKGLDEKKIQEVGKKIKDFNLGDVKFESREQAIKKLKKMLGESGKILDGLEKKKDFLSPSYILILKKAEYGDQAYKLLKSIPEVDDVRYPKETVNKVNKITQIIKIISGITLILLGIISVFIISNTVKLAVFARRNEISIMKYIGATNWFIRWPFIIEGMIIGICGALIALLIISVSYKVTLNYLNTRLIIFNFVPLDIILPKLLFIYTTIGLAIGCIGSMVSIHKYLKV